jgi:hypothetical protein
VRKKGIFLIWAMGITISLSLLLISQPNVNSGHFWIDAFKKNEEFYSHLLTIEDWGRMVLRSEVGVAVDPRKRSLNHNSDNLVVRANIIGADGLINIYLLLNSENGVYKRSLSEFIFKKIFGISDYMQKLKTATQLTEAGQMDKAIKSLAPFDHYFYKGFATSTDFPGSGEISVYNKININSITPDLYNMLFGDGSYENDKTHYFTKPDQLPKSIPLNIKPLFKFKSLFFTIHGDIIINGTTKRILIDLINSDKSDYTIRRKIF